MYGLQTYFNPSDRIIDWYNYLYIFYYIKKKLADFIRVFFGPSHAVRQSWHQFCSTKLLIESGRV